MKQKLGNWLVGVFVFCAGARLPAQEAISDYYGTSGGAGYANGGSGFGFKPLANISVISLGYSQIGLASYYAPDPVQVSLWDSTGDLLTTALIFTDTDSTFNQSYYQTVYPVTLDAGVTYFIGSGDPEQNGVWAGGLTVGSTFSISPDITYLGVAVGANIWDGLQPDSTTYLTVGPDFQYIEIPEPSALALGGLISCCFAFWSRFLSRMKEAGNDDAA